MDTIDSTPPFHFDRFADDLTDKVLLRAKARSTKILRKKDLARKLSCSKSTIDNRRSRTGRWRDETFPQPIPLGPSGKKNSAIGWYEYAIDEWLETRAMEEARNRAHAN